MSRSRYSHGQIEPLIDKRRHPEGPAPAGEDSPMPRSGPRRSRRLAYVDKWQSIIGGGGGGQAGTNGDKEG